MGRAELGQNRAGPKLARFFQAKILTAQPVLKTGPIGPNSLFKAKKKFGRVGPDLAIPGWAIPGWAIPGWAIPDRVKFGPIFFGPII